MSVINCPGIGRGLQRSFRDAGLIDRHSLKFCRWLIFPTALSFVIRTKIRARVSSENDVGILVREARVYKLDAGEAFDRLLLASAITFYNERDSSPRRIVIRWISRRFGRRI